MVMSIMVVLMGNIRGSRETRILMGVFYFNRRNWTHSVNNGNGEC